MKRGSDSGGLRIAGASADITKLFIVRIVLWSLIALVFSYVLLNCYRSSIPFFIICVVLTIFFGKMIHLANTYRSKLMLNIIRIFLAYFIFDTMTEAFLLEDGINVNWGLFLTVVLFVIILFVAQTLIGKLIESLRVEKKKIITNNVVHEVLSEVMEVIDYQPQSHIDEETLLSAALLNPWEQCLGSCYTKAKYKGVNIEFSDVGLLHEGYDSLQVRRKKTFKFKGQWLIIETKKNENWQVTLKERTSSGLIGEKSEFETANKDFNKKFQIQTDRPAALYDFLTARFVVSILKMDEKANARTYICFTNNENGNNRIHVALHNNREMFDFKPLKKFRSDDLPTIKWRIRREIDYVVGVVDEILQNSELF